MEDPDGEGAPRLQLFHKTSFMKDFAPPQDGPDLVPELLQLESLRIDLGVVLRHVDRALIPEKVRRVEHRDVQDVALDPLAAIEEPAEVPDGARDGDAAGVLHRVDGAHLVGDRADAADPRGDVGRLGEVPSPEERLEEPGRLVDPELHLLDLVSLDADEHAALSLDARERVDADGARLLTSAHDSRSPGGTPRHPR